MHLQALGSGRVSRRSPSRSARFLRALLAAVVIATAGAGCDDATGPEVGGLYTLDTVNGSRPPVTIVNTTISGVPYRQAITSGQLDLRSDDTFTVTLVQTITVGSSTQTETESASGTWSASGGTITLFETGQPPEVATVAGNTLTFSVPLPELGTSLALVFKK